MKKEKKKSNISQLFISLFLYLKEHLVFTSSLRTEYQELESLHIHKDKEQGERFIH